MTIFKVSWEIELEAASPLEAAEIAQEWMKSDDWIFYVQEENSDEIFRVDLNEEDENAVLPVNDYQPLIK
jgi:hypothetical protein